MFRSGLALDLGVAPSMVMRVPGFCPLALRLSWRLGCLRLMGALRPPPPLFGELQPSGTA